MVGIISVVIGGHFGGGDHFDGGDHFGGGTGSSIVACEQVLCLGKKIARKGKGNGGFAFPPP